MTINFCFDQIGSKTINAYAQNATFDDVPRDCKVWADRVAKAALDAVRAIPFERNAVNSLTPEEFKKRLIVHRYQKCCGTCKHGVDLCSDGCYQCKHPFIDDDDALYTSEGMVCVAWEATA